MPIKAAKEIASKYVERLPVDIKGIAQQLGIRLLGVPGLDVSGKAFIMEDGTKVITYNLDDSPVRQRFTIAHELGHHVLNHTKNGTMFRDTPDNYRMSYGGYETEANAFAAELLVPSDALDFMVRAKQIYENEILSRIFDVSSTVISYRLKNLGYA